MPPYRCACGQSMLIEEEQRQGVCQSCGREFLLAGPDDATLIRQEGDPSDALVQGVGLGTAPEAFSTVTTAEGIGPYRQLELLRTWRFGDVYQAYHPVLQRHVLVRTLAAEHASDPDVRRQFLSRAAALAKLNHPNVINVLEAGEDRGTPFVAEELFCGRPLAGFGPRTFQQRWREGLFPGRKLYQAMLDAASGLAAIHRAGAVHGRLGPEQIVVSEAGTLKIIGLFDEAPLAPAQAPTEQTGEPLAGTPAQRDLEAFGAAFYRIATGEWPADPVHAAGGNGSVQVRPQGATAINRGVSTAFSKILERCQGADSRPPYGSCDELVHDVQQLLVERVAVCPRGLRQWTALGEAILLFVICSNLGEPTSRYLARWLTESAAISRSPFLPFAALILLSVLYVVGFESALGWTPVRKLAGIRLGTTSGDRPSARRCAARAILKLTVFFLPVIVVLTITGIVSARVGDMPYLAMMVVRPIDLGLFLLGLMAVYARWPAVGQALTFHDAMTGVLLLQPSADRPLAQQAKDSHSAETAPALDQNLGSVDQYDLVGFLGSGGMGSVYRGRDRALGRTVAIKVLAGHLITDAEQVQRFEREARLAAQVSHPNVARVYAAGRWGASPYIAMEFIDGENLQQLVQRQGPLKVEVAWRHVVQAAEALREADRHRIVHRDIKPSNLMVTRQGALKVTDFGISRTVETDMSVTKTGTVLGTPSYMSPEQATGKDVDCRSDIYSLGMTLHFLLAGRPPFHGSNPMDVLAQQLSDEPPSLENAVPRVTAERAAILRRMMAKKKENRYANYDALLDDLRREQPGAAIYATMGVRFIAELINWVLLFVVLLVSVVIGLGWQGDAGVWLNATPAVLSVGMLVMYWWGVHRYGKTFGKRRMRLRVTRPDGARVGLVRAGLRFLLTYPSFLIWNYGILFGTPDDRPFAIALWTNLVLLVISALIAWRDHRRRSIHDWVLDTVVVRIPSSERES